MTTFHWLERSVRRRVPGVDALSMWTSAPFVVEVRVSARRGHDEAEVQEDVFRVLRDEGDAAVVFRVSKYEPGAETPKLKRRGGVAMAGLACPQTDEQLKRALVRLVPELAHLIKRTEGKTVVLEVADSSGRADPNLVAGVQAAAEELFFAGCMVEARAQTRRHPRNDLVNAGFMMPRRSPALSRAAQRDEDEYASRIRRLFESDEGEAISGVDDFSGTAIYMTPSVAETEAVPLPCILGYYDRVYLQMPLGVGSAVPPEALKRLFGVTLDDLVEFARVGRIVPVYKFDLGVYDEELVRPWLERFDLKFVSARELDYLTLRKIWTSNPALSLLRDDPSAAESVKHACNKLRTQGRRHGQPEASSLAELLSWFLLAAEAFEGIAFHKGHIAGGSLGPGGMLPLYTAAIEHVFPNKAVAQTATIDGHAAVMSLAIASGLNTSLSDNMVMNPGIFELVASIFAAAPRDDATLVHDLGRLVPSLDLNYAPDVSARVYNDIFDDAETARVRRIVAELLAGTTDVNKETLLRDRVGHLNRAVNQIRRSALEVRVADVVGDVARGGGAAAGYQLLSLLIGQIVGAAGKAVGSHVFERLVEDTAAGARLDEIRGAINRSSASAIRIYRLRRKLGRA